MPQASEEQRKEWGGQYGVGEDKAMEFLYARGFRLNRDFTWKKPHQHHVLDAKEIGALMFLIDEWDFGGIEERFVG